MDKRQMRITWNENNWEKPSGHPWSKENQGKKNIPFENQYGYGHEEWLFNPRYRIDGYQYGFVRGVENAKLKNEKIDELYLYTKDPNGNQFLIGVLRDVERILVNQNELKSVKETFVKYHSASIDELQEVNADYSKVINEELIKPIMRFKWNNAIILDEPLSIQKDQIKYPRYIPYYLTHQLENALVKALIETPSLEFIAGKANSSSNYTRSINKGKREITSLHVEILDELYKLLIANSNPANISAEKSRVNGKIIDLLEKVDNKFNFYEIKTRNSGLSNIREGLGQILEYALVDEKVIANKIIIIGPSELQPFEIRFLEKLKLTISIPLEFWQFDLEKKKFTKK